MEKTYVKELGFVCETQNIHPSELLGYVKRKFREGTWRSETLTPSGVIGETQRFLNQKHPTGWM